MTEAMCRADAAILYTSASLSHSRARIRAQEARTRIISGPWLSEEGFVRTLSVDVPRLADLTVRLADAVASSRSVSLRTPAGTNMRMELGHPVTAADGICRTPGHLDFFPPGLILSVPVALLATGAAVVGGAITHIGGLATPVTVEFRDGTAVRLC
jgi:leucyl aminopeptidase (aminopeptidase T)